MKNLIMSRAILVVAVGLGAALPVYAAKVPQIAGTFLDPEGDKIKITQKGNQITLTPQLDQQLPPQVKKAMGDLSLKGPMTLKNKNVFGLDLKYHTLFKPEAGVELDMSFHMTAEGKKSKKGLDMAQCSVEADIKVIVNGHNVEAKKETEDCKGLWTRQ
jgi:hypothetical protein